MDVSNLLTHLIASRPQEQPAAAAGRPATTEQMLSLQNMFERQQTADQGLHSDPPLAAYQPQHPQETAVRGIWQGATNSQFQFVDSLGAGSISDTLDQSKIDWAACSATTQPSTPVYGGLSAASPEPGLTPLECRQMMQVLEGAAQGSKDGSAGGLSLPFVLLYLYFGFISASKSCLKRPSGKRLLGEPERSCDFTKTLI